MLSNNAEISCFISYDNIAVCGGFIIYDAKLQSNCQDVSIPNTELIITFTDYGQMPCGRAPGIRRQP